MQRMTEPASALSEPAVPGRKEAPAGFEDFFRGEHVRLLRALFLVTGNAAEAEELMQDAFLAVWERWDRVSRMANPAGYLYRTAMNTFRSRFRRAARAARRMAGDAIGQDEFARADERDAVARALAMLAPRQRAALVLTEMLGFGSEEAGGILGVKAATVRALASQARTALRSRLERDDD